MYQNNNNTVKLGDKKLFGHRKIIYEVNGQIGQGKCVTTSKLFTI